MHYLHSHRTVGLFALFILSQYPQVTYYKLQVIAKNLETIIGQRIRPKTYDGLGQVLILIGPAEVYFGVYYPIGTLSQQRKRELKEKRIYKTYLSLESDLYQALLVLIHYQLLLRKEKKNGYKSRRPSQIIIALIILQNTPSSYDLYQRAQKNTDPPQIYTDTPDPLVVACNYKECGQYFLHVISSKFGHHITIFLLVNAFE